MSDEPKKRRSWGWIGWALLTLFVVYPLSFGPAFILCTKLDSVWVWVPFGLAYMPLLWVCEQNPALKRAMRSYFEWWLG
jgi:hypothetical protein